MTTEPHQLLVDKADLELIRYFAGKLLGASVADADRVSWAIEIADITDIVLDGK